MIYPNGTLFPDDELSPVNSDPIKYPTEYWYPEYLESTGTQSIDTGYNTSSVYYNSFCADLDIQFTSLDISSDRVIGDGNHYFGLLRSATHAGATTWDYAPALDSGGWTSFGTRDTVKHHLTYDLYNKKITLDTTEVSCGHFNRGVVANFFLFGHQASGSCMCKIYYCNIYINGEQTRLLIPAIRKSDMEAGLFDLVEQKFYTNQGTGKFICGPFKVTHSIPTNNLGVTFYRFKATNSEESVYSNTFYVNVIDTEFTNLQTNYNLFVGDSVTINAPAETNEGAVSYKWYKSIDRNNWEEVGDTSSITYVAEQEEMIYLKCKAKNSITEREIETDIITIFVKDVEEGVIEGRALL